MNKLKKVVAAVLSTATIACLAVGGSNVTAGASGTGAGLAEHALNAYYEGWDYVWGGTSVGAVDCSGLIWMYCGGDRMSMLSDAQANGMDWGYVSNGIPRVHGLGLSRPGHVGVYIADGMEVDARGSDYGVCYEAIGGYNNWDCWFKLTAVSYPDTGWEEFNGNSYYYENGEYSVTGTILCWNNVEYTLTLSEPEVVVSEKNFTSEAMVLDIYPADRFFEVSGFDADGNYLLLTINSAAVAGDFASEVDGEYTYAEINGENYVFVSAENIHTTYADGKATVTGTLRLINENNKYDVVDLALDLQAGPYVPSTRNVTLAQMYHANAANDAVGYSFVSEDGMQMFNFAFAVNMWDEDIELGKTYTLADMDPQQSFGRNAAEREYVVYRTVSFKKTATESGIKIEITILDTRGNRWNMIYEGADVEYEALYVELGQANPFAHADGGVEYEMVDKDNSLSCHLVIAGYMGMEDVEIDSLYTSEDGGINLENSYLSIRKVEYKIVEAAFRKEAEGEEVWVSADITDERGYKYNLRFHDDGFVLTGDTIQMSFNAEVSATFDEEGYVWYIYAEGEKYIASFAIDSNEDSPVGIHGYDVELWSSHVEDRRSGKGSQTPPQRSTCHH